MRKKIVCIGIISIFLLMGFVSNSAAEVNTNENKNAVANNDTVQISINVDYNTFWKTDPLILAVVTVECEETGFYETKTIHDDHDPVRKWKYEFDVPVARMGSYEYEYTATWNGQINKGDVTVTSSDRYYDRYVNFRRFASNSAHGSSLTEFLTRTLDDYPILFQLLKNFLIA